MLIRAFARIYAGLNARLIILGEGRLRAQLQDLARTIGVANRVVMPGFHINPGPFYQTAMVFALSSDCEGFGNVIVEAMQAGLTLVSTDCVAGPGEILAGGKYGILVPVGDETALAAALNDLCISRLSKGLGNGRAIRSSGGRIIRCLAAGQDEANRECLIITAGVHLARKAAA